MKWIKLIFSTKFFGFIANFFTVWAHRVTIAKKKRREENERAIREANKVIDANEKFRERMARINKSRKPDKLH